MMAGQKIKAGIATRFGRQIDDLLLDIPKLDYFLSGEVAPSVLVGMFNDTNVNTTNAVAISADKYPNDRWGLCTRSIVRGEGNLTVLSSTVTPSGSPQVIAIPVPAGKVWNVKGIFASNTGGTISYRRCTIKAAGTNFNVAEGTSSNLLFTAGTDYFLSKRNNDSVEVSFTYSVAPTDVTLTVLASEMDE